MVRLLLPIPALPPETVRAEGERFHHLAHVLRLRAGDALEVFDGKGRAFLARVESVEGTSATVRLGPPVEAAPAPELTVVQALPKGEKLDWVLQKGTELGVRRFVLCASARSVVKLAPERAPSRLARWSKIAEEAARQCGRAAVPEVLGPLPLAQAIAALPAGTRLLVLDEEERALRLAGAVAELAPGTPLALAVGPEGGWAREEVAAMAQAGGVPVTLGGNVLRTETAALVAVSILLHLAGQLG